jgi:serine/threonine protein kinase
MHQNIAADASFIARFQREARIVAKLDHPHIVPIYDYDEIDGQPFLVMKYVQGRTLKSLLRDGPLPPDRVLDVMTRIGDALQYAHDEGILHRDIKPSNIILDQRGHPYLMDFGLARIAQSGESTMSADVMLGTPHYISPEQAKGNTDLDARTDVYSLGIVLYELLTGRVPFLGDTSYAIIHDQINTQPPAPHTLNPRIPVKVEDVLLRALAKDRQDRYASPSDLVAAYRDATQGQSISAPDSQIAPRERTPADTAHEPAVSFFDRLQRFGEEAERQFADFEKAVPEGERGREARRRLAEAWKASKDSESKPSKRHTDKSKKKSDNKSSKQDDSAHLPPEERIRKRIESRLNKRTEEFSGWVGHTAFFFFVNIWLFGFDNFINGVMNDTSDISSINFITAIWGIGYIIHTLNTWMSYGPGYMRRQRAIDREVERQAQSLYGKQKNDAFYADDEPPPVRLTGDGEFTQSYVDEIDAKQKRS